MWRVLTLISTLAIASSAGAQSINLQPPSSSPWLPVSTQAVNFQDVQKTLAGINCTKQCGSPYCCVAVQIEILTKNFNDKKLDPKVENFFSTFFSGQKTKNPLTAINCTKQCGSPYCCVAARLSIPGKIAPTCTGADCLPKGVNPWSVIPNCPIPIQMDGSSSLSCEPVCTSCGPDGINVCCGVRCR